MCQCGLPLQMSNVCHLAQLLLTARLKSPEKNTIGELWFDWFIQHYPELPSRYTRQFAECEDPELSKGLFDHVQEAIRRCGILQQDVYNMNEAT